MEDRREEWARPNTAKVGVPCECGGGGTYTCTLCRKANCILQAHLLEFDR